MASGDLERGGGSNGKNRANNYYQSASTGPYYMESAEKQWTSWLVPMFVVANVAVFVVVMYINNCPKNNLGIEGSCVAKFLGRLSFQPLKENPLFGPSSNTTCDMVANAVTLGIVVALRNISVGASGALFGLLGAMLSELLTNWTIYTNKAAALITLVIIIAINLAVGILPHVDNFAHIGGFFAGFLLGFVLLLRPQFGWVERQHLPAGARVKSKHKAYQYVFWVIAVVLLIVGFTVGLVMLFRGENGNDHCSWCHYLSCVPTSKWRCGN
ncbi:hypothetical protein SCA6_005260 [Theobroma cacao]